MHYSASRIITKKIFSVVNVNIYNLLLCKWLSEVTSVTMVAVKSYSFEGSAVVELQEAVIPCLVSPQNEDIITSTPRGSAPALPPGEFKLQLCSSLSSAKLSLAYKFNA